MKTETYNKIREAIENKLQIHAIYEWHKREMCPHVLGLKWNEEQALFCQFWWTSSSEWVITPIKSRWRCLPLSKLENVELVKWDWYTIETQWKQRTSCVDQIHIEIPFT